MLWVLSQPGSGPPSRHGGRRSGVAPAFMDRGNSAVTACIDDLLLAAVLPRCACRRVLPPERFVSQACPRGEASCLKRSGRATCEKYARCARPPQRTESGPAARSSRFPPLSFAAWIAASTERHGPGRDEPSTIHIRRDSRHASPAGPLCGYKQTTCSLSHRRLPAPGI